MANLLFSVTLLPAKVSLRKLCFDYNNSIQSEDNNKLMNADWSFLHQLKRLWQTIIMMHFTSRSTEPTQPHTAVSECDRFTFLAVMGGISWFGIFFLIKVTDCLFVHKYITTQHTQLLAMNLLWKPISQYDHHHIIYHQPAPTSSNQSYWCCTVY